MTSINNVTEFTQNGETDEIEIKIESQEINEEEEHVDTFSNVENSRKTHHSCVNHDSGYNLWTAKATTCLINQYKKYRFMVGQTTQFRSLRDMFDTISVEMQKHNFYFSPQKCANKWRVLERKYKNLVMREMKMKHYGHWEHKRALDEIFSEKRKSVYLNESEYPPVGSSTKNALLLPKSISQNYNNQSVDQTAIKTQKILEKQTDISTLELNEDFVQKKNADAIPQEPIAACFEKFLIEMKKCFDMSEKNKERRHMEMMLLRENELKIQERLLKLKEQKLELQKKKILSMAQNIQLNI